MASELFIKRKLFSALVPKLLCKMMDEGYTPLIGKDGMKHMPKSLHYEGLAIDIDLFDKENTYLFYTESHRIFGEYWENLHPDCRWGGKFKHADGNHYSILYQGRQ